MKQILPICFALLLSVCCLAQTKTKTPPPTLYDSVLAKKLGADEYGMKTYVIGFLKPGKTIIDDSTQRVKLMVLHLKNIQKLAADGKLVGAGPFLDGQNYEGLFIFNVNNVADAIKIAETDPAVKAGVFEIEYHTWYGSAALMEVVRIHNTIQKKKIGG